MKNSNCKLLGYNVCILNKNDIVDKINKSKDRNIIFNLNPIIMVNFNNNIEYKAFINNEKYNIRDIMARETMRNLIESDKNKVTNVFSTLL